MLLEADQPVAVASDECVRRAVGPADGYNFAYLDEQTKKMVRRAILKAVAVPGYQVPFASREMPMPFGWGTGGIQVKLTIQDNQRFAIPVQHGFNHIHLRQGIWLVGNLAVTKRAP